MNIRSPVLSNGPMTQTILRPNYSLRRYMDSNSEQKKLTMKRHKEMQTPRLRALATKEIKPLSGNTCVLESEEKQKVVVIMGGTGSGKSGLSIDLATHFSGEIINSDKLQFYDGLEITTNQMSVQDRRGIPHHLLGDLPKDGELSAAEFRSAADHAISAIVSRGKLPILAGGSHSFVHALIAQNWDPEVNPFNGLGTICFDLRYDCCFIWIDVSLPVLFQYHSRRVDKMLELGMFEELAEFYDPRNDPGESGTRMGLWKAIGVPEFDRFFRKYPPGNTQETINKEDWDEAKKSAYEKAVRETKENTFELAKKQIEKILKMKSAGWDIKRIDATAWLRAVLSSPAKENDGVEGQKRCREIWEEEVVKPCVEIVKNKMF